MTVANILVEVSEPFVTSHSDHPQTMLLSSYYKALGQEGGVLLKE